MTKRLILFLGLFAGTAGLALGQNTTYERHETTKQSQDGSMSTTTTTKTTTFSGSIVRYEPGRTIVLREGNKTVTYTLTPTVEVPGDIAIGKVVTITTEPGSHAVTRVVTNDTDSQGRMRQTTETREVDAQGNMKTTTTTNVFGTVESYEAGKTITILKPTGEKVTYVITNQSQLPGDVSVGKKVTIYTAPGAQPAVKSVTVTTETTNPPQP